MNRNLIKTNMYNLLDKYDHYPSLDIMDNIIDTWSSNKRELLSLFSKHPEWDDEKSMLVFSEKHTRSFDKNLATDMFYYIYNNANDMPTDVKLSALGLVSQLESRFVPTIPDSFYNLCKERMPDAHVSRGSKITKALRKLFTYVGFSDNYTTFEKDFAKLADALSPYTVTTYTIISLNPCDYLTMSFGNSWSSCHTIDKDNLRGMPGGYQGMYASGTMSYMLDKTSFILYQVSNDSDISEPYLLPKIRRQMFHYDEGLLIQGRSYPDACNEEFILSSRLLVEDAISTCLSVPNSWKRATSVTDVDYYTYGTNYPDYEEFPTQCNAAYLKPIVGDGVSFCDLSICIGHAPICVACGREHGNSGYLTCCGNHTCIHCGEHCSDEREVDGGYVCDDCLEDFYYICEDCGHPVHRDYACHVVGDTYDYYVCQEHSQNYYRCENCDDYMNTDYMTEVEIENSIEHWCNECVERGLNDGSLIRCEECGMIVSAHDINDTPSGWLCNECMESVEV